MKKVYLAFLVLALSPVILFAQVPALSTKGKIPQIGQLYGKVEDAQTGKPIEFATVTLLRLRDSSIVTGMLTKGNGDFSLENLPLGRFRLKVNFLGYQTIEKIVAIFPPNVDQDLGNFKLSLTPAALKTVDVTATKSTYTLGIDKKVFNVEKSLTTIGGTAEDVLKEVPAVSVDINGNVTVRNSTPQIFVDGKPTELTLDQIPADAIATIEVITNPSAKYDASGQGGIINIVLKKNKKAGINGMIMAGAGTGNQYNAGGNLNIRQNPFNFYLNYNHFQNMQTYTGVNNMQILNSSGTSYYTDQNTNGTNKRYFNFGRVGMDFYLDNRNTISVEEGLFAGNFNTNEGLNTSYMDGEKILDSSSIRNTYNHRNFHGTRSQISYNHDFIKSKENFSAFINYHIFHNGGNGNYLTDNFAPDNNQLSSTSQNNNSAGKTTFVIGQADYTDPLKNNAKFETGIKTTDRDYTSFYNAYDIISGQPVFNGLLSSNYKYEENVNAAYVDLSQTINNFSYEAGLRTEQSHYQGTLISSNTTYSNNYISLFPSVFISQKFKHNQELQINYSRRVDRPNFWQLIPYVDYSSAPSLSKGNPDLKPEFINSFELNYNYQFIKGNLLASLYFRNSNNNITNVYIPLTGDTTLTTYANANTTNTYGFEFTIQNNITNWWDVTTNFNLYQTDIKAGNIQGDLKDQGYNVSSSLNNNGFSWFAKINSTTQLPANFTFQLTGDYRAPQPTPQGKTLGFGGVDIAVKKDFLKNKAASLTLSLSDVFDTRKYETEITQGYLLQNDIQRVESRILRLNFMYRFGKFNAKLFKRNNNKAQQDNSIQQQLGPGTGAGGTTGGPRN